jgi:anti-anti-sigma factor
MPIETKKQAGKCTCYLSGDLRIWEAAEIWHQLYPLLISAEPLCIDLQAVNSCDGAGVQILCQVLRQAADRGADTVTVGGVSETVVSTLQQAGVDTQALLFLQGEV